MTTDELLDQIEQIFAKLPGTQLHSELINLDIESKLRFTEQLLRQTALSNAEAHQRLDRHEGNS